MLHDLNIPRMGSVENAKLVGWRVAEGDSFAAGDVLYEIETDKTTTEVEATEGGVLARQLATAGDEFKVGDKIGLWAGAGISPAALKSALGEIEASAPEEAPVETAVAPTTVACSPSDPVRPISMKTAGGVRISPLARRLAAQHGVSVAGLTGSGAGGKITGNDILAAASAKSVPAPVTPAPVAAPPIAAPLPEARSAVTPAAAQSGAQVVPHTLRRKTIARRMTEAGSVPSLTADMDIDLTQLMALRKRPEGEGSSVLGLIAAAAVSALLEHPRLNAHWGDEALTIFHEVHLGIAVDSPDGLVVPVIRNAERLSARGITGEIARLAQAARNGSLTSADLEGATFTISNPGSVGPVVRAEALLNVPQIALLGLPGITRVAMPIADGAGGWALAVRQVIRAGLTFDHRALDGGPVITFLNTLRARIESL